MHRKIFRHLNNVYSLFKIQFQSHCIQCFDLRPILFTSVDAHELRIYGGIGRSNCKTGAIHGIILNVRNETGLGFSR